MQNDPWAIIVKRFECAQLQRESYCGSDYCNYGFVRFGRVAFINECAWGLVRITIIARVLDKCVLGELRKVYEVLNAQLVIFH